MPTNTVPRLQNHSKVHKRRKVQPRGHGIVRFVSQVPPGFLHLFAGLSSRHFRSGQFGVFRSFRKEDLLWEVPMIVKFDLSAHVVLLLEFDPARDITELN
jgi:hypothetical protein